MSDDDQQMHELDFLKAQFFMSAPDAAAAKAARDQRRTLTAGRRRERASFLAMRRLVRALSEQEYPARRAWVLWLVDRYLGTAARDAAARASTEPATQRDTERTV